MHQLVGYHRPRSIDEAVGLLGEPGRLALGGGTTIRHDGGAPPVEVVDLQALGLDAIAGGATVHAGANVTLQALADDEAVPDLVRRAARLELPSTLRTLATIGGTVGAAEADSVLLAALLVHGAVVRFADGRSAPLGAVLHAGRSPADLVLDVAFDPSGRTSMAATGRTPRDTPIVAALGRASGDDLRVAVTGVAPHPTLIDPGRPDDIEPAGDFRGSAAYRRHLAGVLVARVVKDLA